VKRVKIDRNKCIGCLTCTTACIISHGSADNRSRVVVDSYGKYAPIFCRHCEKPECVYTCMTGAMKKNPDTGIVEYDKDHCAHCFMCIMACPYGVLKPDSIEHKEIMKCDMCKDTESASPNCVGKCPMHAITLEEV